MWLDDIPLGCAPAAGERYPFSFVYAGKPSDDVLAAWPREERSVEIDANRTRITTVWTDPDTGLRVHWEAIRFADFPALDWLVHFENGGAADTPVIEDILPLDMCVPMPASTS